MILKFLGLILILKKKKFLLDNDFFHIRNKVIDKKKGEYF